MGRGTRYNETYKREAVDKAKSGGNVSQTARELGISSKTLHGWIKRYGEANPIDVTEATPAELFDYIEVFYNRRRLHSSIDYEYPINPVA